MEKKCDVVVVGELNVDIILNNIQGLPEIGKEILAENMRLTMGSSSAIFACNLSSLGINVAFSGKVGFDDFGTFLINSLKDKKIDITNVIQTANCNTGATIVLNYEQDRANVTYPGAMNDFSIKDIEFDFLAQAKHMHFSSYFLQPELRNQIVFLFKKAKELGLTTSLDPQWDPAEEWDMPLEELLPHVDIFFPNKAEILHLTHTDTIEKAIDKIRSAANNIVVKNGSEGAVGWNGKKLIYQKPFFNEEVVDCIGAGDSFNAGFISKYIIHADFESCLEFGALTGAINTTHAGGTGAFKDLESVKTIAQTKFAYSI